MKRLNEIVNLNFNDLIFDKIDLDFTETELSSTNLNIILMSKYGEGFISSLVELILGEDEKLTSEKLRNLADIISEKYLENWKFIYKALYADYNPIENYNMKESEEAEGSNTSKSTDKNEMANKLLSSETENKRNSFNSENPKLSDKSTSTNESESINEGTNEIESESETLRTLTRSGNIGVTTNQQMIESELKLRNNNFIDYIMNDTKNELILSIF